MSSTSLLHLHSPAKQGRSALPIFGILATSVLAIALTLVSASVDAQDGNAARHAASDTVSQFLKALGDADAQAVYQFSTGAYWREFDRKKQEIGGLSGYLLQSAQRPVEYLVSCSACQKQECWTLTSVQIQGPPPTRDTVLFVTRKTAEGTRVYGSYQWTKENRATFDSMEGGICR